jgi:hypothetical protein
LLFDGIDEAGTKVLVGSMHRQLSLTTIIAKNVEAASMLMTDESPIYPKIGKEFANHGTVNHSADEYVRLCGYIHINTAENFFSIFKRGIIGSYHHVSEAHLHRYVGEFDYRYNTRTLTDAERMANSVSGIVGKLIGGLAKPLSET